MTMTLLNTNKNYDFQTKTAGPSPEAMTQTQHDLEKDRENNGENWRRSPGRGRHRSMLWVQARTYYVDLLCMQDGCTERTLRHDVGGDRAPS